MQALVDSFWGQYRHWMNLNGQYKHCTSPPRPIQALDHFFQEPMYATKHSFNSRWRHCLVPIYVEWCRHETILSRVICNYLKPLHALNELICMDNVGSRWPFSESIQAFVQPMQGSNGLTCICQVNADMRRPLARVNAGTECLSMSIQVLHDILSRANAVSLVYYLTPIRRLMKKKTKKANIDFKHFC